MPEIPHRQPSATQTPAGAPIDIVPEIEKALVALVEEAEQRAIRWQLHFLPAPLCVTVHRDLLQQVLLQSFQTLLTVSAKGSIINVYISDGDGKCIVEAVRRNKRSPVSAPEDYFRRYRITNAKYPREEEMFVSCKKIMEDIGGEISFTREARLRIKLKLS